MTIELAPKAPASHKTAGTDANSAKTNAQNDTRSASKTVKASATTDKSTSKVGSDGSSDAGAGGFSAILSSLGDGSMQGAADAGGSGQALLAADDPKSMDGQLSATGDPAALSAHGVIPLSVDAAARADTDPAKAALAAAMAAAAGNKPAGFADASQAGGEQDGALRLQSGSQLTPGGNAKGHTKADLNTLAAQSDASAAAGTGTNGPDSAAGSKAETTPSFDLKMFAAMQEARGTPSANVPQLATASGLISPDKRAGERSESAKGSTDSVYSAAPVGVSSNANTLGGATEVAPAPDMQAAEQVKYWISQDVQNAQLKLDGLGDKPVEVNISVNGNEAHVTFRTDEIQARGLLESAGGHLKDMLAREGLLLAGVSVGTSGSSDGGGNERKPRQGAKQGLVSAALPVGSVDVANRARSASGRSLDLFV